jgi:translation initiation factor IF-1
MVKNTTGGSKSKGMARKNVNAAKQSSKLRTAVEVGEVYAVVVKIFGGARCLVIGMDKIERACIIRGKFRGGQRRDNTLVPGKLVLIGDRDWTSEKKDKLHECDLLEVYSDIDKERLKKNETKVDWSFANITDGTKLSSTGISIQDNDDLFTKDTAQDEYAELMKAAIAAESKGIKTTIKFDTADEGNVDIDDI